MKYFVNLVMAVLIVLAANTTQTTQRVTVNDGNKTQQYVVRNLFQQTSPNTTKETKTIWQGGRQIQKSTTTTTRNVK